LLYLFQRYQIVNLFDRVYTGVGAIAHLELHNIAFLFFYFSPDSNNFGDSTVALCWLFYILTGSILLY